MAIFLPQRRSSFPVVQVEPCRTGPILGHVLNNVYRSDLEQIWDVETTELKLEIRNPTQTIR
jgi:hypothetical protein